MSPGYGGYGKRWHGHQMMSQSPSFSRNSDSFPPQKLWTWLCVQGAREQGWMMVIPVLIVLLCPAGSMYDGLADNYNNYGTTSRSSYFSKFQAGNGSWGYPVRNYFHHERSRTFVGMARGSRWRELTLVAQKEECRLQSVSQDCNLGCWLGHCLRGDYVQSPLVLIGYF